MSDSEFFALILSIIISFITWIGWYRDASVNILVVRNASRSIIMITPVICAIFLFAVLKRWAASDVRDSGIYLLFYMVMGAAWVGACSYFFPFLGISIRDDAAERQNLAAAWASAGILAGVTFCFAGGNIGNGPGWWVVIFSTLLSTGSFFVLWAMFESITNASESVTVERDVGKGLLLAGLLCGTGIILGRSVAGDWLSVSATVTDFIRIGWPAFALVGAAAAIERFSWLYSNQKQSSVSSGIVFGGIYLVVSILYVFVWQAVIE
jgi:hypothetical protein